MCKVLGLHCYSEVSKDSLDNPAAISETDNFFMIAIPISDWCPGSKPYTDLLQPVANN